MRGQQENCVDLQLFSERLKNRRKNHFDWSVEELAKRSGVSARGIADYEARKAPRVSLEIVIKLAAALKCSVGWLIGEREDEKPDFSKQSGNFPHYGESETHLLGEGGAGELRQLLRRAEIVEGDMRLLRQGLADLIERERRISSSPAESLADTMLDEDIARVRAAARPGAATAAPAPHTRAGSGGESARASAPGKPTHNRGNDSTT